MFLSQYKYYMIFSLCKTGLLHVVFRFWSLRQGEMYSMIFFKAKIEEKLNKP